MAIMCLQLIESRELRHPDAIENVKLCKRNKHHISLGNTMNVHESVSQSSSVLKEVLAGGPEPWLLLATTEQE